MPGPTEPPPKATNAPEYPSVVLGVLNDTYDMTGLGTFLSEHGADIRYEPPSDQGKATGYELVRRLDLAQKRLRALRLAVNNTEALLDRALHLAREK